VEKLMRLTSTLTPSCRIFLFITLIFVGFLAVVAHKRAISGFRKGTLYAE
jgi:hypothetical protein